MYRLLAIVLLVLLPLQFTWAAVASYCGHESQASAAHFGHHDHEHAGGAKTPSEPGPAADQSTTASSAPDKTGGAEGGKTPGAADLDCGHCHGTCGLMSTVPIGLPGALSTSSPTTCLDEASGAHAPTRPERPQWLPLA